MPRFSSIAVAAALVGSAAALHAAGCPASFLAGTPYGPDATVTVPTTTNEADIYRCKATPMNLYCGAGGFEPGAGLYWRQAWTKEGHCDSNGPLVPASAPVVPVPATSPGAGIDCSSSRVCGNGLACLHSGINGSDRWYCGGLQAVPVTPPAPMPVVPAPSVGAMVPMNLGGCPGPWTALATYPPGARVSKNGVVYQCNPWPMDGHCGQPGYEPASSWAGTPLWSYVWHTAGVCSGTGPVIPLPAPVVPAPVVPAPVPVPIVPVSAPTLPLMAGCPGFWSAGANYQAGDKITFASTAVMIVYECKPYPSTSHCNEANYVPGSAYSSVAWTAKATCTGSMAPTAAPIAYTGSCFYTNGSNAQVPVEPWTGSKNYVTGDVVRVGSKRFKCGSFPFDVWCKLAIYAPTLDAIDIWTDAWAVDGTCPAAPTAEPTVSKNPTTASPTRAPTTGAPSSTPSTVGPTKSPSATPSVEPSNDPSDVPSMVPNFSPSDEPSGSPSNKPSGEPSSSPSNDPSGEPSVAPSDEPSLKPSLEPSKEPSAEPSDEPSDIPSVVPSVEPSDEPSQVPSGMPSDKPSVTP